MTDTLDDLFGEPTAEAPPVETVYADPAGQADDRQVSDGGPSERRPSRKAARKSTAELFSFIWGGAGMALVRSGADVPVGRVLSFQAPLAGEKFDELIAHTFLDPFIQPLVDRTDTLKGLGSILLFPLLVGAVERNPEIGGMTEALLRQLVTASLVDMAPVIRKQRAAEKRAATAIRDLSDVLDFEVGNGDPIDAILQAIFAPAAVADSP